MGIVAFIFKKWNNWLPMSNLTFYLINWCLPQQKTDAVKQLMNKTYMRMAS
jgi:hypothetical protein